MLSVRKCGRATNLRMDDVQMQIMNVLVNQSVRVGDGFVSHFVSSYPLLSEWGIPK